MENLSNLLSLYQKDDRTLTISEHCKKEDSARIQLKGCVAAIDNFMLAANYLNTKVEQVYIAFDKEEAAYIYNNLENLLGSGIVSFLPDSFKYPGYFESLNNTNVLMRNDAVDKLLHKSIKGSIIVTYPEALFEHVVSPKLLKKATIEIKKDEEIDVDFLIEVLINYGFERVDFVYEPGQFSIRGGIVDIYSYGNEWPYRIELFDDDVESIRTFDPMTQLSKQQIAFVSIVPNLNTEFGKGEKVSFFETVPSNSVFWIQDMESMVTKLGICFEKSMKLSEQLKRADDPALAKVFEEAAFLDPADLANQLERFDLVFNKANHAVPCTVEIEVQSKPQPSFNRNFKLLIEALENHQKEGIKNIIFAYNSRQVKRFFSIFEDLGAEITFTPIVQSINSGFIDLDLKLAIFTDHQIFDRFYKYKLRKGFSKAQAMNLKLLRELKPGDFVTHIDHGVGRYSGLEKININGHIQESVRLFYKNNDALYVSINSLHKISKFSGKDGKAPALNKLGTDAWKTLKRKTKRKVKDIAAGLIRLYAKRKATKGFAFEEDSYLQNELEASFIYEDTPDQFTATIDVKNDMQKEIPMDRLICGDVGFGKTEIAIRAAFKAVVNGKQVAILVPTTILALQHFKTFSERLKNFPVTVDYINRFRTTKEKNSIFESLKEGKIDIVIGTHGLLNKKIGFKDLGLLVIDEEQKFGVAAKEKIRNLKVNVDTLVLTATPIPRTLQFSLMAARDLSIIRTAPPNRQPIHTELRILNNELIRDAIYYEIERAGQVFFVHNRVKSLPQMQIMLNKLCPDVVIRTAHGQLEAKKLEETLLDFIDGKFDLLLCTNIIETGLDIPNANTIIINNAHQFGMSDLHQLRGRVGRSNKKAYCYLFSPPMSVLTSDARKRLKALEEFSDLGSGFNIAMRDLDIRGAGNLLGGEQSGFISDIGFETYQKILDEAIQELKENEFKDLFKGEMEQKRAFVHDVQIETDVEMLIPDQYVNNIQERFNLYTEMDKLSEKEALITFSANLKDRFGPIPTEVKELFQGLYLRWVAKRLGFERVSLKRNKLRCYFVFNAQSAYYETALFKQILTYVAKNGAKKQMTLKQSNKYLILIKENVRGLKKAAHFLEDLEEEMNHRIAQNLSA